ncbi:MAG: hypothetical protein LJE91_06775 [Gammaproteobacteria bacterium]|jgi:hypothetical protein|nr:hypothetical protein [Gammaproteobacteria bacterium]
MKTVFKFVLLASTATFVFMADWTPRSSSSMPMQGFQLVSEAHALFGRQRRMRRRGLAVGYAAGSASGAAAASAAAASEESHQATAPPPQPAPAAAPAPAPASAPAADGKPLPIGTVVPSLPAGCTSTPAGGVEYYYCGGNFYRAVFEGNKLVYVTAKP